MLSRTPFQYPIRRFIIRSREVSNPRNDYLYLKLSDRSEIWQAFREHCCWCACQISKLCDNWYYQSRGFETSRNLTIRRLILYWNKVKLFYSIHSGTVTDYQMPNGAMPFASPLLLTIHATRLIISGATGPKMCYHQTPEEFSLLILNNNHNLLWLLMPSRRNTDNHHRHVHLFCYVSYGPLTRNAKLRLCMRREYRECFPRHRSK